MSKEYDLMFRDDDKLYDMIEDEINKKFTFKRLCKNIDVKDISDNTENEIDFKQNQCFYMCNENIRSIKSCKNNSIDNIMIKSRQIKKLKILKKTFQSDNSESELSVVTIASTKINDIENKVIIKDFYDDYEMMYELFIANVLKNDPVIEQHICGYFGKKSNTSKLLLEYIQGKTLNDMTNLNMKDFSDIISQLFLILNYAYNKYGFLHGDLHTENFLILHNKNTDEEFDIELPLSNGKFIKYKSPYKVVLIDFGLSHLKYKFNKDSKVENVRMLPLEEEILGFNCSIPLIDITKLLVFIMIEIIYENKHKKLTEVGVYITNLIQYLYSIIGKPNKNINSKFFVKSKLNYGYIYDLINSNLEISFEELYIKFVSGTRMDIHKIETYFDSEKFDKLKGKSLKDELDDTEVVIKIINKITNENISLNDKIEKIIEFIKDLDKITNKEKGEKSIKKKFSKEQIKYIYLNLFHYTCRYELNKNIFTDENDMIVKVNKIYSKFIDNKIIHENITNDEKYKVINELIEFKLNKFLDCFLENTDIHNILNKYNKLNQISSEQIDSIKSQHLNKILKSLLIKNYNKLPYKIFQKNFIDNEINVKKFNTIEQMKYLSNIVFELKKQMIKLDININKTQFEKEIKPTNRSHKSHIYHLKLFFYNLYKYCEKYSFDILEKSKDDFIDWISYNRIILYDYYIRHISLSDIPNNFSKLYLDIIQLEDEIWEKFYKKDNFNSMANSITFSENMLNLLVNKDFSKLIKKIESTDYKNNNIINSIKNESNSFELTNQEINEIIKPFKKIYFNF